jgi:hypothetical protein
MDYSILYWNIAERLLVDFVGINLMILGIYFRNYRRRDLAAVFITANLGLFSVLTVLATSTLSAAVGFGLFGVLSIIRLRSREFEHIEIAYFFMALAMALITAIDTHPVQLSIALVGLLILVMAIADSYRARNIHTDVNLTLGAVFESEHELIEYIEKKLNCKVNVVKTRSINYVSESTSVSVVYKPNE